MKGCIHIYCGDGKGKTTAAVGLALRFAGQGGNVLFAQFLKDGTSGEIGVLKQTAGITVLPCEKSFGFSFRMDERQRQEAAACYGQYLRRIWREAAGGAYGLLIMDEAVTACNLGFVELGELAACLREKPEGLEIVLTGRDPAAELTELADYVSEIRKKKHPFDAGLAARRGIEW